MDIIIEGTIIETAKEIKSKFSIINELNKFFEINFPTKILL